MGADDAAAIHFSLDDKYTRDEGRIYLTGIQSLVRILIDQRRADMRQGLNTAGLVSGYPGSPIGGFDIELGRQKRHLKANEIVHLPGLNEDLAATALWGAQTLHAVGDARFDGVFGMWYGKAPGVDRSGDALRHGNMRGVGANGGVLAVAGDDPLPVSSMIPSDSNVAFYDFQMPILVPGDVQDILDLGLHGYALSRAAGLWVGFKMVSSVADSAGTVIVGPRRVIPVIPTVEFDGKPFRPQIRINEAGAPMREAERDLFHARLELARRYGYENRLNPVTVNPTSAWLGIVAGGKTYYDLRRALSNLGLNDSTLERLGIRLLKLRCIYPLDPRTIRDFADGLDEILVVEEKRPFVEMFIKDILFSQAKRPVVVGKWDEQSGVLLRAHTELDTDAIERAVGARLVRRLEVPSVKARIAYLDRPRPGVIQLSTARGPYFCSGCPHSRSLEVPDGALVGAGIGCHVMALYMGKETFGKVVGYTQMGGEGAQWAGLAPFTNRRHFIQNLGDGTFAHSGSLAVRFAVSSGANITYKLLYNQAISMTGGQAIMGAMSVPDLARMLQAEGVRRIVVTTDDIDKYRGITLPSNTTLRHRDDMLAVERELAAIDGVTVLIHDQQCAAEKRRLRKRGQLVTPAKSVLINERVCEGCGDCGQKSNCLSVHPVDTEFGRKTRIHQSSCNKDFSCMLGNCPSFMTIEKAPGTRPQGMQVPKAVALPPQDFTLPGPEFAASDAWGLIMMGIGGTGVVTANQILSAAAVMDGYHVRGLDVTGFSQKAGPVKSELQLFRHEADQANSLSTGGADLYLVFDPLVGVDAVNLGKADPERTVAVVSTGRVPTGRMVADIRAKYPDPSLLRSRIDGATRSTDNVYLDAQRIAEDLIGDAMAGNMVLIGAAYQAGRIPLTEASIVRAIELNGTAVGMNHAAFGLGRLSVANPGRLEGMLDGVVHASAADSPAAPADARVDSLVNATGASGELRRMLQIRVADLADYQDIAYARSYADFVARVHACESRACPGEDAFAQAVARNLHKLMACKDEYEVARLLLMSTPADTEGKVYWHLQPSFLRALGVKRKLKLGRWFRPVLQALRAMKGMRGGAFDLFGRGKLRQTERDLIGEYRMIVEWAMERLSSQTHEAAVELAYLPDQIRGYESVKLGNVERYRGQVEPTRRKLAAAWAGRSEVAVSA